MDTTTIISLTGTFLKTVSEVVADLKRQELARLDVDLLNLKRTQLTDNFDDFKSELESAVKQEKAQAEQDLISRGLANSTLRQSKLRAIEKDASTKSEKATRECSRAIEEIALLEQKINERARPWWKKLLHCRGIARS